LYSMLTRGAQGVGALVGILLVSRVLDGATQGYYFTILALIAFVQLSEFGMTYAVMQSASHEPTLPNAELGQAAGGTARLRALLQGATRFNWATTALATLLVATVGTRILASGEPLDSAFRADWGRAWIATLAGVALLQLLNPRISLLEGAGFVADVWRLRFSQELVAAIVLWIALISGARLWAISLSIGVRALIGFAWAFGGWRRNYFTRMKRLGVLDCTDRYWRREVWPFQWRIGVSALSGYLIFQFFTPLLFAIKGAEAAGQFGMTLTITNGLLTVTTAWLNSQAPRFGKLIAERRYDELDKEFGRSLKSSLGLAILAGFGLAFCVLILDLAKQPISQRLLAPGPFGLFVLATVTNHAIFAMAVYLRAHRREPLMVPSVVGAIATPIVVGLVARRSDNMAIAIAYLVLTVAGLVVTGAIFTSRSRAWHVDSFA
jgi:O-antigen/teichoic acid export membrane protein